ncbi:hypothetical protein N180_14605 [Pedobacter antarcticus 4BY]|uniref:DarT domain-containing protein n=2 Tax=Pedobacter antarcticus TaxID=34086 RepID=A0A081PI20_9SPHI|nr:DUF4433 domain-containing protein [Pedobacter antarcticus]KEQ30343.1 hypothetical protein N180_14605 [Pedobacter antarcticus 4BY]SFE73560.1 protein of unknown function [Pedobacter antarcticus]
MEIDIKKTWIFRIIPVQNLEHNLRHGLYSKNGANTIPGYLSIGSIDVITQRDTRPVKCYPDYVVNDCVPFYFSKRTPMLYNIITGHGVKPIAQSEIIYLCFKLEDLACDEFRWCYTNGNAAKWITKFFDSFDDIDVNIDWHSIKTDDFRDANADGDEDRIRKKHAEFLVLHHVPPEFIRKIVVLNPRVRAEVEAIIAAQKMDINVLVNPKQLFYFT